MTNISDLLAGYPRKRPPLPPGNARIYVEEYKRNRGVDAKGLYRAIARLESWMHRRVASRAPGQRVLEIGAGTLNHRRYERSAIIYDVVEPLTALYEESPEISQVDNVYTTVQDIPLSQHYDRIFSIAVLEHVEDLPALVGACGLRLANGGVFQAGIPAEGGLAWGTAWRLTTGISYRLRTGLPYAPVMRHEHVNTAAEIVAIVRYLFDDLVVRWFPFPARHLAFYGYLEARNPRLNRCAEAVR